MDYFAIIEDGTALIYQSGVYRQAKLYRRGNNIYAQIGSGFVLLCGHNATSHPKILWKEIMADGVEVKGNSAPRWDRACK